MLYEVITDDTLMEWNARFPEMLRLPSPLARPGTPAIAIFRFLATLGAFGVGVTEGQVRARMDRLIHPPNADDVHWIGGHHLRFSAHTMVDGGWVWRIVITSYSIHYTKLYEHVA